MSAELPVYLVTIGLAGLLVRPVLRRIPLPGWLARARLRGRPGVPVTAWLLVLLLLGLAWLAGERRGLAALVLLGVWLLAPVVAAWVTSLWLRRPRRPA
jgi:hypothetical protein